MFKNSKTWIIILVAAVVALVIFFPTFGSNVKEYKDTNGEENYSLCKITDEDIIEGIDSSTISLVSSDGTKFYYLATYFNGASSLGTDEPLNSYSTIEILDFTVTKGNARLLILADDKIVHDFTPNEANQSFSLSNLQGDISLIIAGESSNFEVTFKVLS